MILFYILLLTWPGGNKASTPSETRQPTAGLPHAYITMNPAPTPSRVPVVAPSRGNPPSREVVAPLNLWDFIGQSTLAETLRTTIKWLRVGSTWKIKSNASLVISSTAVLKWRWRGWAENNHAVFVSSCQPLSKTGLPLAATWRRKHLFWTSSDSRQHTSRV